MTFSYLCVPNEDNSFYDTKIVNNLSPVLVLVFGSNLSGRHGKGAAKQAVKEYGAIYGVGVGLQGRSYAIPTKDRKIVTLPLDKIKEHIDRFIEFTCETDMWFYVTPIGTGLAGYKHEDIAPMFKGVKRCWLPLEWRKYLLTEEEIKERLNRKDNICPLIRIPLASS